MALTAYMTNPEVVVYGGAFKDDLSYIGDGASTFKAGELIRITTSGTIQAAGTDSDTTGAVSGMIISDLDAATTDIIPILKFAGDTELRIQLSTGTPADVAKGTNVTLATSSNKWAATATTTKGIATIKAYESDSTPFTDRTGNYQYASDEDYGYIRVTFAQAILDANGAAV